MAKWGIEWNSKVEGKSILWKGLTPYVFATKKKATNFIRKRWGYIATRKDLRGPPHYWRMPQAVKVRIKVEKIK